MWVKICERGGWWEQQQRAYLVSHGSWPPVKVVGTLQLRRRRVSVLVPVGGEGGAGGAGVGGAGGERAGGEGGGLEEVPVLVAAVCPHSNMLRTHLARAVVADSSTPKKLLPLHNSWELVWFWWDYKNQLDTILGWIRKILAREGGSTGFLFLRTSSIHRNNPSSKHLPAVVVWQHCFSIKERNYKSPAACIEKLYQLLFWTQSSLQPSVLFLASVWIINGKGFSSFNIWPHWTQARWMCVCISIGISLLWFDVFHWGPIPPARAGWVETADVVPTLHLSLLLDF